MDKRFLMILAAVVVIFGGIFWFTKSKSNAPGTSSNNSQSSGSNHVIGNNTTGVALIEYGDYQCPACGQYFPIVKQLQAQYNDKISFQFANFPLVQIHQNAMAAARAAEAAALQNKFWEMHDMLYESQSSWSETPNPAPYFEQYAKQLGLNVDKFKTDSASPGVLSTINADIAKAKAAGGNGTPTFVINGRKVENNPASFEEFTKLIDQTIELQKQKQ